AADRAGGPQAAGPMSLANSLYTPRNRSGAATSARVSTSRGGIPGTGGAPGGGWVTGTPANDAMRFAHSGVSTKPSKVTVESMSRTNAIVETSTGRVERRPTAGGLRFHSRSARDARA